MSVMQIISTIIMPHMLTQLEILQYRGSMYLPALNQQKTLDERTSQYSYARTTSPISKFP